MFDAHAFPLGLAYGHAINQAMVHLGQGDRVGDTLMWGAGPPIAGTLLGLGVAAYVDEKNLKSYAQENNLVDIPVANVQKNWILAGSIIGVIGSCIYYTYQDDEDDKVEWTSNINFYAIIILVAYLSYIVYIKKFNTGFVDIKKYM